uniref:Uncharacterized protein n=1 Tax=Anguilla anguilla TaxID=7936 RepID=A0A0E9XLC6_ANGAN
MVYYVGYIISLS